MNNKIYILLDRSGSMETMWKEAINGINGYVEKVENKNTDVFVAVFDTTGYDVIRNTSITEFKPISTSEIEPRGGTPLLDSAGRIMWNMLDSGADRAILVIVTDGYENSSSKFRASEIKELSKELTIKKNYDIVFLGANFDGIGDVATQNFGLVDSSRFMKTSSRGLGVALNATAAGTTAYFGTGIKASAFYDNATKAQAASE